MALFKILQGLDANKPTTLTNGYCYFTIDNNMFYVDHPNASGTLVRSPLNAQNANTLTADSKAGTVAKLVQAMSSSGLEIPSCNAVYSYLHDTVIPDLEGLIDLKMDKVNPTGTGSFSLNRDTNHTPGAYSVAIGYQTIASGDYSFAEGYGSIANNSYAHAEGANTKASGFRSHAEGHGTEASGNNSHTEGSWTKALGKYSHAEGNSTKATGDASHAQNQGTQADGEAQTVIGRFNIADTTSAFIIGNGSSDTIRTNCFTVDWSGNAVLKGTLTVSNPTQSTHAATKSYVDTMIESVVQLTIIREV